MAGDAALAPLLLALGLEEFSLHPATLLEVRHAIRDSDLSRLRARANSLLRARDRKGIEAWIAANAAASDPGTAAVGAASAATHFADCLSRLKPLPQATCKGVPRPAGDNDRMNA